MTVLQIIWSCNANLSSIFNTAMMLLHYYVYCMQICVSFQCYIMRSIFKVKMDMDSAANAIKEEHVQVEESDDSCTFEFFEIVPLARNTDGSCTTECVSGDWSAEVKQENLAVVKQEPDDVRCVIFVVFTL